MCTDEDIDDEGYGVRDMRAAMKASAQQARKEWDAPPETRGDNGAGPSNAPLPPDDNTAPGVLRAHSTHAHNTQRFTHATSYYASITRARPAIMQDAPQPAL